MWKPLQFHWKWLQSHSIAFILCTAVVKCIRQANSTAPKMAFNIDRHHKGRIEQILVMLIGHLKWRRWKCNNHQILWIEMFHRRNDQDKFSMENDFNCRSLGDCIMLRSWTRCSTSKPQWSTKTENAQIWTGISKPIEFEMIIFYYGALCRMHCVRLHSSIVIVRRWCDFKPGILLFSQFHSWCVCV